MCRRHLAVLALLTSLTAAPRAEGYFVIQLRDGGELRADFVREDGGKLYAARGPGEVEIDRGRVLSVREIDPGVKIDSVAPVATGASEAAERAQAPATVAPTTDDLRERDRKVARQVILGHRDLLFAQLRGDSEADLEKRRFELDELERERQGIRKQIPAWERDAR